MLFSQKLNRFYKLVILCILFLALVNFHLIYKITNPPFSDKSSEITPAKPVLKRKIPKNTTLIALQKVNERLNSVSSFFDTFEIPLIPISRFQKLLSARAFPNKEELWKVAESWVMKDRVIPSYAPFLPSLLEHLRTVPILRADFPSSGSQLKVLLLLEGGQYALFKPKWYEPERVIKGGVYSGRDRHNGEIVAFHLARLLDLNRVPIVTLRTLNLRTQVLRIASPLLKETFYEKDGNICFYGVCPNCKKMSGICGKGEMLEGSITLWLPNRMPIKKARHPWQRTYADKPAHWEIYPDYCEMVKKKMFPDEDRLLDLIEISIFDFLIDNGDRHHYEFFNVENSKVLLIDNAKSFGNPHVDHIDILAPLYQCCRLRRSFLSILISLQNGALSQWLRNLLRMDQLENIIHESHYKAMDRRLVTVLSTILLCFEENGSTNVLVPSS